MKRLIPILLLTLLPLQVFASDADKQLRNLPKPEKARFEIKDRDWPAKVGEASVCLWKDDKLAAVSVTIDDNHVQDHPFWLETGQKYGFRFTWFVITRRVGQDGIGGKWEDFIKLQKAGHDIQSHTVDHFNATQGPPLPVEDNYAKAIPAIEKNLPGSKVLTLAYPGGTKPDPNDPEIAAKYYIAARGTVGTFNPVNKINYINTHSVGNGPKLDPNYWAGLPNAIKFNEKRANDFRAWISIHYHGVNDQLKKTIAANFDYIKEHAADFWMDPFTDVAKYGQERDTAKLVPGAASDSEVQFTLTDSMDDQLFDMPLTVKVRLNAAWKDVTATQDGKAISARVIEHEKNRYALVQAVPDRGVVSIKPK
jgi:peptidoglycan/xylan/chitin deacetylase (PgdA/CDA1 family)